MESKLAVTLILSVLLASWISDCEGFVGPFPTDGKRLLQKTGNLPALFTYLKCSGFFWPQALTMVHIEQVDPLKHSYKFH